ncbi:MAG TPA: PHP-associated domain-containing protein [Ktedonobacteraceae bacterium]|nr:PHP-associated domain-containing protein [Ktedonobacteraceae bacterium]
MATIKRDNVTNMSESACAGTAMLEKRRQMTQQQAHYAGKLGRADLHMHSTYSDGVASIEQILYYVQHHTDLDVIALTDHDVIEGSLRMRDLWAKGNYRFDFVVGEEISTKEGHMLALYIEKRIQPGLSMERSIDLVHEQGGLAIVAHPLNPIFRHSCQREVLDRIFTERAVWLDGIESWNASFCGIGANRIAMRANREIYGWSEVGNSDAHTLSAIGRGRTWFEGKSADDVRRTIESGLSAPGGKLWGVNDYLRLARHHMGKDGKIGRRLQNRKIGRRLRVA